MAVTRFHFIAGLPGAGAERLTRVLAENPRIAARSGTAAAELYGAVRARIADPSAPESRLGPEERRALVRGTLEAVYHDRPPGAAAIDCNPAWLPRVGELAEAFPLSRFILMVRDAQDLPDPARGGGGGGRGGDGTAEARRALRAAISGAAVDRVLVIQRDRLLADPLTVMDVLYHFLREPGFDHDFGPLAAPPGDGAKRGAPRGGLLRRLFARRGGQDRAA